MANENDSPRRIGLVTCTRKKKDGPCPVRNFYSKSKKFAVHRAFAEKEYDTVYVISARHGLLSLDHVLTRYDCFLGSFSHEERLSWSSFIATCLRHEGMRAGDKLYLHTDALYRDYLLHALYPYCVQVRWVDFDSSPATPALH